MAEKQEQQWEPSTWDELFPGRFLKHSHLSEIGTQVTIERVYNTLVDGELAQVARIAPVKGIEQVDWGLNKTNGLCLRAMFGDSIKSWWGKRVVIRSSLVEHGREKGKPCIRVCASPDIPADLTVVIDFKTKKIKPFTIRVRSTQAQAQKADASPEARALSVKYKQSENLVQLNELAIEIESALEENTITRDEGKELLTRVEAKAKALVDKARAEKESANVIS